MAINKDIDNPVIKDMMHKYQHTADVRLGITYKKENGTNKFVFKEDK